MSHQHSTPQAFIQNYRHQVSVEVFEHVRYVFQDWSEERRSYIGHDTISMFWFNPFSLFTVSESTLNPLATKFSTMKDICIENKIIYDSFLLSRPELEIQAMHDVQLRINGKKNDGRHIFRNKVVPLRRTIHLLDVAIRIVRSRTEFPPLTDNFYHVILGYSSGSLACVHCVALCLRQFMNLQKSPRIMSVEVPSPRVIRNIYNIDSAQDGSKRIPDVAVQQKNELRRLEIRT